MILLWPAIWRGFARIDLPGGGARSRPLGRRHEASPGEALCIIIRYRNRTLFSRASPGNSMGRLQSY